jgi:hypothetical protein
MFWLTLIDHVEVIDLWLEDMIEVLETGFERTWYCCNKCNIVLEELYTMMQVIEAAIKAPDRVRLIISDLEPKAVINTMDIYYVSRYIPIKVNCYL